LPLLLYLLKKKGLFANVYPCNFQTYRNLFYFKTQKRRRKNMRKEEKEGKVLKLTPANFSKKKFSLRKVCLF